MIIDTNDPVNHPAHYTKGKIECIDALRESLSLEEFLGFLKGNVMKYLWRAEWKGGVEDYSKARWYLEQIISTIQHQQVIDMMGELQKEEK